MGSVIWFETSLGEAQRVIQNRLVVELKIPTRKNMLASEATVMSATNLWKYTLQGSVIHFHTYNSCDKLID